MGIGNRAPSPLVDFPVFPTQLITPHGDRELARVHGAPLARRDSLPLMGIGNTHTSGTGGSEINSLPLMGIGNRRASS